MEKNVKPVDLFSAYDNMERIRILEGRLRQATCDGDTEAVQELLNLGVDVNARFVDTWYYSNNLLHYVSISLLLLLIVRFKVLNLIM